MSASKPRPRVLIVDNDDRETNALRSTLSARFVCEVASSGETGLAALASSEFDVVVASTALPSMTSLDLLDSVHHQRPDTAFILIGDDAGVASVIEAGQRGACDYIVRPFEDAALSESVHRAVAQLRTRPGARPSKGNLTSPETSIIGLSARLTETLDATERVAHASAPVLLVGETGTGKALLAARIHALGPRRHRPFVTVTAGAVPSLLLDGELFGQVAGSAGSARRGVVAEAAGGTLFLDEIADLPLEVQGRLLRVIESGAIRPLGADHDQAVDVRFVAATQCDLAQAVLARAFREDLYFRFSVLAIHVPPLRERREDLPALIAHFFDTARARNPRSPVDEIAPAAHKALLRYGWPGNVRELQGFIERLVVLGKGSRVELEDVELLGAAVKTKDSSAPDGEPLESLREMTLRHVEAVLASTHGDKARAAATLGIDISTLYRWQRRPPGA